jgi:allantoate deiminase
MNDNFTPSAAPENPPRTPQAMPSESATAAPPAASEAVLRHAAEIMRRCDALAEATEEDGRITRRYLCEPMHRVHDALGEWMRRARLEPRVDPAGNLIGHRAGATSQRVLLLGSHLDSVPGAGRYDGVLGVLLALAAVEMVGGDLPFAVDVLGFSEEEGVRFAMPYLGSRAVAGTFRSEWLMRCDSTGCSMERAIRQFGLEPSSIADAAYDPAKVIGYVEPHLEQGPTLERAGLPIGLVDAIAGQSRLRLRFVGEAGHAGTTPMEGRRDALVGAARWVDRVRALGLETAGLRATVGSLCVAPNAPNVIPAEVEVSLDVRHPDDAVRDAAVATLLGAGREIAGDEGLSIELLDRNDTPAVRVDHRLCDTLDAAARDLGIECPRLTSGAGHDAVPLAERFPVAMLFVRHPGGVSHHPEERVDEADVAVALAVLVRFLERMANDFAGSN